MRQIFATLANFCQIRAIKSSQKKFLFPFFQISKTHISTLASLLIKDGHFKNILLDIKQKKSREHRKKYVNLFIISASFDLLLGIQLRIKFFIYK